MSISFNPIAPWPVIVLVALAVSGLTIWAYLLRLRGATGRWRWFALGLRLAAVVLCLVAAVRPSVVMQEKKKQPASILFLLDRSTSMAINDGVGGASRWDQAIKALAAAREAAKGLMPDLEMRVYRFDSTLKEDKPEDVAKPDGMSTSLGSALVEAIKRQAGMRVAAMFVLSDGANNEGTPPLAAAERLKAQQVPVVAAGFGTADAGAGSRDIAMRDIVAGPTVFEKNKLDARGSLIARGYPGQTLTVDLMVSGENGGKPVSSKEVKVPEGGGVVPFSGLEFTPKTAGEKVVSIRVRPKDDELVKTNNEVSTIISVLQGGLNVLYLQGPNFTWDYKYLIRAIETSQNIRVDTSVIRKQAVGGVGGIEDSEFAPGKYNVYILGDMPANFLTQAQQRLLADAVRKNAGLMMLGGRSSFGAGGWAGTDLARTVVPVDLHPGDGQIEPKDGLKVVPNLGGIQDFVLRIASTREESARIWRELPPIPGANRFGDLKPSAVLLASSPPPESEPLMVGMDAGSGRVLAFGGETWIWARATDEGRAAHRRFWRQAIFWLSHKEDSGGDQVKLKLDRRRVALGQKVDLTVSARDSKGEPLSDVRYETTVTAVDADKKPIAPGPGERVEVYPQGEEARGSHFATAGPGTYLVQVKATRQGKEIGTDEARFLVYQDDRELENPAADLGLLRQVAETTGGTFLAPEQLAKYIRGLKKDEFTQFASLTEHRIWDNWWFFLAFLSVLTLEWWLRKRNGWV